MNLNTIIVREGKVEIVVPNPKDYVRRDRVIEPSWSPIFYNPLMVMNRDIAVLVTALLSRLRSRKISNVADILAGTGVRAIRFCVESNTEIACIANDIDQNAYNAIIRNIKLNNVRDRVIAFRKDANELLYEFKREGIRLDYIDIDPFGSPAPFIRSAISNIRDGGVVAVTATDTAPLSGSRWWAGSRKYDVFLGKNDIGDEIGLRVLTGFIARRASENDKYIKPLIAYKRKHYYRVYVEVHEGARESSEMLESKLGYILICERSGYRMFIDLINMKNLKNLPKCPVDEKATVIGPLWIDNLSDKEFIHNLVVLLKSDFRYLQTYHYMFLLLNDLINEVGLNMVFNLSTLSRYCKVNIPKLEVICNCLKSLGYKCTRAHYEGHYIRTNAPWEDIISCIKKPSP